MVEERGLSQCGIIFYNKESIFFPEKTSIESFREDGVLLVLRRPELSLVAKINTKNRLKFQLNEKFTKISKNL